MAFGLSTAQFSNQYAQPSLLLSPIPPSAIDETSNSDDLCCLRARITSLHPTAGLLSPSVSAPLVVAPDDTFGIRVGRQLSKNDNLEAQDHAITPTIGILLSSATDPALPLSVQSSSLSCPSAIHLPTILASGSVEDARSFTDVFGGCSDELPRRLGLSSLRFLGTLGRGAYGKVMLAAVDSQESPIHVAVKVLGKARMSLDDAREVKSEVRILRILAGGDARGDGSAFVQKMHDAFQTSTHVFVVMVGS